MHTVRLGTLLSVVSKAGPPEPYAVTAQVENGDHGIFGNLGLNAIEPYETILDYAHQRLIVMAGHRLVRVPAYTPVETIGLVATGYVPGSFPAFLDPNHNYWGLCVHKGSGVDTMIVDTGSPTSDQFDSEAEQTADQLKQASSPMSSSTIGQGPRVPNIWCICSAISFSTG